MQQWGVLLCLFGDGFGDVDVYLRLTGGGHLPCFGVVGGDFELCAKGDEFVGINKAAFVCGGIAAGIGGDCLLDDGLHLTGQCGRVAGGGRGGCF